MCHNVACFNIVDMNWMNFAKRNVVGFSLLLAWFKIIYTTTYLFKVMGNSIAY